jgi:hypothetical protein
MITSTRPTSSAITPMLLTLAITRTPAMLIRVVATIRMDPSSTAFFAPSGVP